MTRLRNVRLGAVVAIALGVAACGGASAAGVTTAAPATTQATEPDPLLITAVDYGYEGLPERVPAGTTIELRNVSDKEVHEFVAIRLPDDEERPVEDLVQLPPEEMAAFFPMVEAVLIAPPSETGFAVEGTGELTEPGRYAIICVIPTGADPGEYLGAAAEAEGGPPEVDGGLPHIANGMYAELIVTG